MRIQCDCYLEPTQGGRAREKQATQLRPAVWKNTCVAVDRDEVFLLILLILLMFCSRACN